MINNGFWINKNNFLIEIDKFDVLSWQVSVSLSNLQFPPHQESTLIFVLGQSLQLGDKVPLPHETFTKSLVNEKKK